MSLSRARPPCSIRYPVFRLLILSLVLDPLEQTVTPLYITKYPILFTTACSRSRRVQGLLT